MLIEPVHQPELMRRREVEWLRAVSFDLAIVAIVVIVSLTAVSRRETADQKHYFSSETGYLFGSQQTTRAIYDKANRNLTAPAAQNL